MAPVQLIIVGGFLGAGKTTLLWAAARRLIARGRRVGLVTNDQAPDLVDTALLRDRGLDVREVAGSCFCCNFQGLIDALQGLRHDVHADVLLAEPVGSCTDLSATILQPLKAAADLDLNLAPLSVLADPERLLDILTGRDPGLHPSAAYILRKQLEEADVIVVNKADLLTAGETDELRALVELTFPRTELRFLSALDGSGIDDWLQAALAGGPTGAKIAEVDYDTYAEGEAVLGWLNTDIRLAAPGGADWRQFAADLLAALQRRFQADARAVGHVKLLLSTAGGDCQANLTRTNGTIFIRDRIYGSPAEAELIFNARVEMPPAELDALLREILTALTGDAITVNIRHLSSFRPSRPKPTHRYTDIV